VAERSPGSNRGRPSIDWEEAFAYYASLPDSERSYRAVAGYFGVSVRTVEAHGRKEHWKERLAQIRANVADAAAHELVESRLASLAQLNLLIDASWTLYAHQVTAGQVRVSPSDLPRLYKLREEINAQIAAESSGRPVAEAPDREFEDAEQRKLELIAALEEAGVFERLRNLLHKGSGDGADVAGDEDGA
jgi:hypothetical protein